MSPRVVRFVGVVMVCQALNLGFFRGLLFIVGLSFFVEWREYKA